MKITEVRNLFSVAMVTPFTEWLFKEELKFGTVKRLLTAYQTQGPALSAVTPVSRRYSAKVKALLDYLSGHFASEASLDI